MKWYETPEGIKKRNETYKRKFKEKYGVDNPQQLKDIQEKTKKTSEEKYGGIGYTSSYACKCNEKTKERYGDSNPMKTERGKQNFRQSILKKQGVDNPLKDPEIAKKVSETMKEKIKNEGHWMKGKTYEELYGNKAEERREQQRYYGLKGYLLTPRISAPQLKLYEEILKQYPTAVLEYPVGCFCIDIAVPELKLAFEYDGEYWHQDKEKDKKRDEILHQLGWKVTRINE